MWHVFLATPSMRDPELCGLFFDNHTVAHKYTCTTHLTTTTRIAIMIVIIMIIMMVGGLLDMVDTRFSRDQMLVVIHHLAANTTNYRDNYNAQHILFDMVVYQWLAML